MTAEIVVLNSLSEIKPDEWDALAAGNPLLSHAYLESLESTHCAVPRTGWLPQHIALLRNGRLQAALPLYGKMHSRGEYVFDHAWADAYARYGMNYFPKLVSAVPFTPVPGPRLLARDPADRPALLHAAKQLARDEGYSSLHVLFPHDDEVEMLRREGLMLRANVQFHWQNHGYENMAAFIAALTQSRRKRLNQERRKLAEAGVSFRWLTGRQIDSDTLRFMYLCYMQTYLEHGNRPYLNLNFFERIHDRMGDAMVVVLAERHGQAVAAALNIRDGDRLYGRYWGCTEFVPGLHFETCYVQGIEYAIAHGIQVFEGGAQGEHKLARGMLPVQTWSAHWVDDPVFGPAIADFLQRETPFIEEYMMQLAEHSPFRREQSARGKAPGASGEDEQAIRPTPPR